MSELLVDQDQPYEDVRLEAGSFSIPELKWRELLFVGALRADGEAFVRDPTRPLPAFKVPDLFPPGVRFVTQPSGGRVVVRRLV